MIKPGDLVRVVKLPHDQWTPKMPIGREFVVFRIRGEGHYGHVCYDDSNHVYIPIACLELVTNAAEGDPVELPPAAPPPKKWPTRSDLVARLSAEMDTPLSDRIRRLR